MDIKVSGSNMSAGTALTEHVEEHLEKKVKKYFENAVNADVHFSKEKSSFCVKIIVNEGVKGGIDIKSDATGEDVYGAFNEATEKVAKQLRRYKRKIKNHRREQGGLKSVDINSKLLQGQNNISVPSDFANSNLKTEALINPETMDIIAKKTARIDEINEEQEKLLLLLAKELESSEEQ